MTSIPRYLIDHSTGLAPVHLADYGADRLLGQTVERWSANFGLEGKSPAGFVWLALRGAPDGPLTNVVIALWDAGHWLLFDGQWVESHPRYWPLQRPLYSSFDPSWDDLSASLLGSRIVAISLTKRALEIALHGRRGLHRLLLPDDPAALPRFAGTDKPRRLEPTDDLMQAIVICEGELQAHF